MIIFYHLNNMTDADIIEQLPVDQSLPTHDEINLINTIFKKEKTNIQKILNEFKDVLFVGIIFIVLSIPYTENMIKSIVPMTYNYTYLTLIIKALIFIVLFWLIKNFWLIQK